MRGLLLAALLLAGCGDDEVGDQFNAGKVWVAGAELGVAHDIPLAPGLTLPVSATYTFTWSRFRNSFTSNFPQFGNVLAGDRLPAPADITEIASTDWPQPAERPLDTRLDASRLQRVWHIEPGDWQAGLRAVIDARYS